MNRKKIFALLVSDGNGCFEDLKLVLNCLGIETCSTRSCEDVAHMAEQTHPELIFTATDLADGTWTEIVKQARELAAPTNVIVVGKRKDTKLYLSTIDAGAFDFILPPFDPADTLHVVRVAAHNARRRRNEQAMKDLA